MERIIGIDFGTSTTYMNVKRYNGDQPVEDKFSYMPVMFNYGESSGYVATIARENADGSFDFGEKASEPLEGSKIHTEIKMRLESPDEGEQAEARRITREFFKFLHEQYAQQAANLGGADDTEETVISYPVKWQNETAEFMLDAARAAGFQNVRGMDEATAAVSTVLCHDTGKGLLYADKPGYLMLIDMGAGTTDLVVCKYSARTGGGIDVELVTSWPQSADEPTFGGREIDAVLEQYVEDYLTKSLLNQNLLSIARDFATKPGESKKWKERHVSVNLADGKPATTCGYVSPLRSMLSADFPAFDRAGFEAMVESGLRDYVRLIRGCLEKTAEVDKGFSALDLVILTGGHSAWYFAREIIDGTMNGYLDSEVLKAVREDKRRVVSLPNPQTTVSLGLVYSKLPFRLEKKPAQKSGQDFHQTRSIEMPHQKTAHQRSTEDETFASTMADAEAFYTQAAQTFFAEKTCDLRAVNFAISRLNIPSGEEMFWAEGIIKGAADPGTYAVTECGVYLQGAFGGKHHLSWTEFVSAEWAGRAFAAPSWQNGDNWDASIPLVVKQEKGPLKELHTHLRGFHGTLTVQATTQTPVEYTWSPQLIPVVKHFLQEAPAFARRNELRNTSLVAQMSKNFQLDSAEEIFYVKNWGQGPYRGIQGTVITSAGIHANAAPNAMAERFMTWWEFLNSHFEYRDDSRQEENRVVISGKGVKVSFRGDQADSIRELHDLLCERAANLQKAAASKQTAKAAHPAVPIVILPFDAKAMSNAMSIHTYLIISEIATEDTVTIDDRDLPLGQRIRTAEAEKDCYVLVVKDEESISWLLSVRRFGKDIGVMDIDQFEDMYRSEMLQQKAAKQPSHEPALAKKEGRTVPASGKPDWESIIRQVIVMTQITSDPRTNKNTDTLRQVCQVRGGETVLLSFDNTTTQNGKGGVVLTDGAIYTRQWPLSPDRYLWKDFAEQDPCPSYFGGINVGHIMIPYCSEAFHDFIWRLNQHMKR